MPKSSIEVWDWSLLTMTAKVWSLLRTAIAAAEARRICGELLEAGLDRVRPAMALVSDCRSRSWRNPSHRPADLPGSIDYRRRPIPLRSRIGPMLPRFTDHAAAIGVPGETASPKFR